MTNYVLLLGAGFSRNWGGWLIKETFEYLLGCSLDAKTRAMLWTPRGEARNFEEVLEDLRVEFERTGAVGEKQRLVPAFLKA
jgi:hypothetical protein